MSTLLLGLHLATAHLDAGEKHLNDYNPGVYVSTADGMTVGTYRNSDRRRSNYVGRTFSSSSGNWGLTIGAVTGYQHRVLPLVVPSYKARFSDTTAVRAGLLPKAGPNGVLGLHFSIEWKLQGD